jgi:hypothetical protein
MYILPEFRFATGFLDRYPETVPAYRNVEQMSRLCAGGSGRSEQPHRRFRGGAEFRQSLLALVSCVESKIDLGQGQNRAAAEKARSVIGLAGNQQKRIAIESRLTLAQALARSGGHASLLIARRGFAAG